MSRPVLALLPPLGHDSELFAPLAARLRETWDVHALDYPGFGARSHVTLPQLAARAVDEAGRLALLDALVADALAQLQERNVAPDVLGGVSLGGTLSLRLHSLLARPPRALLLMASGGRRVASVRQHGVRAAMNQLGDVAFALQHLGLASSGATGVDDGHAQEAGESAAHELGAGQHYARVTPEVSAYLEHLRTRVWQGAGLEARARAAVAMLDAALSIDFEDAMRSNRVPALVVAGERDRIFTPRYIARYVQVLAGCETQCLPGVGHYPPLEAPDEVAALLQKTLPETHARP
jgi:pimeloyl-ACP methyl ester carboxylesterase